MIVKRKCTWLVAGLLGLALLGGCGSAAAVDNMASSTAETQLRAAEPLMEAPAAAYDDGYDGGEYYEEEALYAQTETYDEADVAALADSARTTSPAGGADVALPIDVPSIETDDRKIVYTVDLSLQTTEFDEGVGQIPEMVEAAGGFVQDSYVQGSNINDRYYNRSASFTVRVPVGKLNAFTEDLGGIFHIVSQQKSSSDISNSYYDTQARLDSLRIQEERLKAMLETADELQYLLEVERELAQVLYEIESMTSSLRRMDSSVNLSTITIHLQEVSIIDDNQPEPKPVTFGQRVSEAVSDSLSGFVSFCQELVLLLIAVVPFLLVLLVIALLIWLFVRTVLRRAAKRQAKRQAELAQQRSASAKAQQVAPQQQVKPGESSKPALPKPDKQDKV